ALDYVATELERGIKEGKKLQAAVKSLLTKMIKENKRIIFNGNGYSDEWQRDASKRGLLNLRTSVDAFPELMKPDVVQAFEKYGVLNERELRARYEVAHEQYNKTINIEANLMVLMGNRYILPAAYRYQSEVAQSVTAVKAAGGSAKEARRTLDTVCRLTDELKVRIDHLQELLDHEANGDAEKHAKYFRDKVVPAMNALRETGDSIECVMPHDLWPLPTYREMLFVK
ncbi:MAG TPA: glutamine synthetase type III, partial [Candidatus Limnocylindria bacterium]|nr:glutamine synthetase type III [Candidatus Limnocylindria bacterium]